MLPTIKSNTNVFHGTAWIFNNHSKFKARNSFQSTPHNRKYIINQFGLKFGGPVRIPGVVDLRNKLFFFVNWARTTRRITAPPRFFSVAPPDLRESNFAATGTLSTIRLRRRIRLAGCRSPITPSPGRASIWRPTSLSSGCLVPAFPARTTSIISQLSAPAPSTGTTWTSKSTSS